MADFDKPEELEKIIEHIDEFGENLTDWEFNFITDMIDNPPENLSEKQINIINRIYRERC